MTASRPTAAAGAAAMGGNFNTTFQQVQADVAAYIARGDGGAARGSQGGALGQPAVNPQAASLQAMALRNHAGGAIAGGAIDGGTEGGGIDGALQQQFLASIKPWAEETAGKLGVSPELVAAHAALESGWGQQPLRRGGADSNNLFGLKANSGWQGAVALASTTEYEHGALLRKTERFRSYPDAASAFRDYASMLTSNPRYAAALNTGSDAHAFASGLARAGYASDPHYADKLSKVATQLQRSGGLGGVTPTGN